jgi:3-oxoacyl-[acyl-carrier-protein] synthase-3
MRSRIESIGTSLSTEKKFIKRGSVDYCVAAGKRCLENSVYKPSEVQLMISTGVFRDKHILEPALAAFVQDRLGINCSFGGLKTFSFDLINSGCGMLNAIDIINRLTITGEKRIGMVVSSDVNPDKNPDPNYTYQESGVALIIDRSTNNSVGFGSITFKTFDLYQKYYSAVVSIRKKYGNLYIRKNADLERAYLSCVGTVLDEVLKKEKITREDIDLVIPSQISGSFISGLEDALKFPGERILNVLDTTKGDTHTTSVFIGLDHAIKTGIIKPKQNIVLLSVGAGITVGGAVYYS